MRNARKRRQQIALAIFVRYAQTDEWRTQIKRILLGRLSMVRYPPDLTQGRMAGLDSATLTRSIFLVAALTVVAEPACPQNFNLPWCATIYTQGTTQCTYYTQQECLETLSGVGGECTANPSAGTPTMGPSAPPPDFIRTTRGLGSGSSART